jgi:hypothetical protein
MKRFAPLAVIAFVALASPTEAALKAGAFKVNIAPQPAAYGGVWEQNEANCAGNLSYVGNLTVFWPENPNCIYSGGFGLGTAPYGLGNNALTAFDTEYGLWVRSVAVSDGTDTVVLTILDGAYYFGKYDNMCDRCGFFHLGEDLGEELGIAPENFLFASTHSHAAPDFIGGWGGVPTWYMNQVTDALKTSVRGAVAALEPARLEAGEILARQYNSDRRDTYYSAEEAGLSWFRANAADGQEPPRTIATVASYAGHPTGHGDGPLAHPDYLGAFDKRVEQRFGGVGLYFMSGLGNMSKFGGDSIGVALADLIPPVGQGQAVVGEDVRAKQVRWNHPVTNVPLGSLGAAGGFDRTFEPMPAAVAVQTKGSLRPCVSTSAVSVDTGIEAIRIGNLTITGGPGELFANITNTVKERSPWVALPIALANDGLGYIMQSREYDPASGEALGFIGGGVFEYEDAYAIDGCLGDKVLFEIMNALDGL